MPNGARILLRPVLAPAGLGKVVTGVTLGMSTFGAGPAELKKDQPKPARVVLSGAFLDKARDEAKAPPKFTEFASLKGTITLTGKPLAAQFTLGASIDYTDASPKGNFRRVRLRYDAASVKGAPPEPAPPPPDTQPPAPSPLAFLRLPVEPKDSRFLVIAAALEIDGKVVATTADNDMLDLPLPPIGLRVVNADPQFASSTENFSLTYAVGGLVGSQVTLEISSPHYAGGPLFKRLLSDAELVDGNHTFEWDGKCNTKTGDLAQQFLTPLFAPYKLKLSDGASHSAETPVRVLYHSLSLEEGGQTADDTEPPTSDQKRWVQFKLNQLGYYGGAVGHDFDDYLKKAVIRYKANHVKMHEIVYSNYNDTITPDFLAALTAGDNPHPSVDVDAFRRRAARSKIFVEALTYEETAGGGSEFLTSGAPTFATAKAKMEQQRLNRPLIPVLARVLLRNKAGKGVEAPAAIGPVRVNWLFIDVRDDLSRQVKSKPTEPSRTRAYVELALKTKGGRTATTGDNAHQDYGGIRGNNDYKSAFVVGTAYEPYDVKDDAGQKVCFSVAGTDAAKFPNRVGKAGVFFRPSYIAGDAYQLRADLDFSTLPNHVELDKLHGVTSKSKRVSGRTGTFEIWRRGKVAARLTWPKRTKDPEWGKIKAEFAHANVDIDVSSIAVRPITDFLSLADYRAVVTANTVHTNPTLIILNADAMVGVVLPAQGNKNAADYKTLLTQFTQGDYWNRIFSPLRRKLTEKIRKVYPTGFVIVEFLGHVPVNVQKAPPGDTSIAFANYITWVGSWGEPDSTVLADQKDPDKIYYVISHEMGHNFWLTHWENALGSTPADHDKSDHNCSMSYSNNSGAFAFQAEGKYTPHFCGQCILKLRGWDTDVAALPAQS